MHPAIPNRDVASPWEHTDNGMELSWHHIIPFRCSGEFGPVLWIAT